MPFKINATLACGLSVALCCSIVVGDDWPQWMGTHRDGVYREKGIVKRIPDSGLPILWRTEIGAGYSGPAVADGRVFVMDYVKSSGELTNSSGGRDRLSGNERILCLDAKSGKEIWKHEYSRPYNLSYGAGPRATPTVDGDRVYALGAEGDLTCLNAISGETIWAKQLVQGEDVESPIWGHAAHPLVHGDLLYCLGGSEGKVVAALNKFTGSVIWEALTASEMGYCPPSIQEFSGVEQLIIWHADSLNGLDPKTGDVLWSEPLIPQYGMAISAPRRLGNLLFASGIGKTAVMLEIGRDGKPAKTLWKGRTNAGIYSANSTPIFTEDAIFGSDCETGKFIAVNPADGQRYWESFQLTTGGKRRASHGTAFIVKHNDRYLLFTETGDLVFADLSKDGFEEKGRMHVLQPTNSCFGRSVVWSHPAFANRCMIARNDNEIVCVNLAR